MYRELNLWFVIPGTTLFERYKKGILSSLEAIHLLSLHLLFPSYYSMSSQIVLILGAGQNMGKSFAQKYASKGFKVAIASRTLSPEIQKLADTSVKADFTNPSSIKSVFEKVKLEIGIPNVIIYNGKSQGSINSL